MRINLLIVISSRERKCSTIVAINCFRILVCNLIFCTISQDEVIHEQTNGEVVDDKHDDAVSLHVDGEEQLDFEAEEGEVSPKVETKAIKEDDSKPEIEEQSDLEEGELSDEADTKPEETERPICRFFSRGHCTWGSNCRYLLEFSYIVWYSKQRYFNVRIW